MVDRERLAHEVRSDETDKADDTDLALRQSRSRVK